MLLARLRVEPLSLRLRAPLRTAHAEYRAREGFLVRAEAGHGATGWGEAMPLPEFGTEDVVTCGRALAAAAEALAGVVLDAVEDVGFELRQAPLGDAPAARHAIELALLDLLARDARLPLARLLAPRPRPFVRVNALLAERDPVALREEARAARAQGFTTAKLKVGGAPLAEDLARVEAALTGGARARLDAHGAWAAETARAVLRSLPPGVELCEQPLPARDVEGLRGLQREVPCLLAADESLGVPGAEDALLRGSPAVGVLVLKPMVLGGVLPALALARRAAACGVASYVTSALDGVVARAGAAHLGAALPGARFASGLAVGALFADEPPGHPFVPRAGRIPLPSGAGLGVTP